MLDNLSKSGLKLANKCALCVKDANSINHLLLHCSFIVEIQNLVLKDCHLSMVFPKIVNDLMIQ